MIVNLHIVDVSATTSEKGPCQEIFTKKNNNLRLVNRGPRAYHVTIQHVMDNLWPSLCIDMAVKIDEKGGGREILKKV